MRYDGKRTWGVLMALGVGLVSSYALPFWRYGEDGYDYQLSGIRYMLENHANLWPCLLVLLVLSVWLRRRDVVYFAAVLWLFSMIFLLSPSFALDRNVVTLWTQFQAFRDYIQFGYYVTFALGCVFWLLLLRFQGPSSHANRTDEMSLGQ